MDQSEIKQGRAERMAFIYARRHGYERAIPAREIKKKAMYRARQGAKIALEALINAPPEASTAFRVGWRRELARQLLAIGPLGKD